METIKKYRFYLKLSQKDLAKKIGVTQATISEWENGKTKPRAEKLLQLARVFGCTVDKLLQGENDKIA